MFFEVSMLVLNNRTLGLISSTGPFEQHRWVAKAMPIIGRHLIEVLTPTEPVGEHLAWSKNGLGCVGSHMLTFVCHLP